MDESELIEKFHLAISREREEERREGIHVTSLVYDCLRRCYYQQTIPLTILDPAGAVRMWVGRKCHETQILNGEMEVELEMDGIVGRIDEYKDGFILDKKTTRSIPKRSAREHHVKQVNYYAVLCAENNTPVKKGGILYVNPGTPETLAYVWDINNIQALKREMLKRKDTVERCIKDGILPPRKMRTWPGSSTRLVCSYCNYFGICMEEDINDPRFKEE